MHMQQRETGTLCARSPCPLLPTVRHSVMGNVPRFPAPSLLAAAEKPPNQKHVHKLITYITRYTDTRHTYLAATAIGSQGIEPGTQCGRGSAASLGLPRSPPSKHLLAWGKRLRYPATSLNASTKDAWELVGGGLTACAKSNHVNLYSLLRGCVYKRLGLRCCLLSCLYGTESLVHHQVWDPVFGGRVLPAMPGVSLVCCGEM